MNYYDPLLQARQSQVEILETVSGSRRPTPSIGIRASGIFWSNCDQELGV
jgi:hypothetical protein